MAKLLTRVFLFLIFASVFISRVNIQYCLLLLRTRLDSSGVRRSQVKSAESDEVFLILLLMNFLEKDLEEILRTTPNDCLGRAGLDFAYYSDMFFTQVRIGNYGVADMIAYSRHGGDILISVVELKKDKIDVSAFFQALRYARGIQRFFELRGYKQNGPFLTKSFYRVEIHIVLIGREMNTTGETGRFCYLTDLMPFNFFEFYTYNYEFSGISFKKHEGFHLPDEGFKKMQKKERKLSLASAS